VLIADDLPELERPAKAISALRIGRQITQVGNGRVKDRLLEEGHGMNPGRV
jgi:hypothetical protein